MVAWNGFEPGAANHGTPRSNCSRHRCGTGHRPGIAQAFGAEGSAVIVNDLRQETAEATAASIRQSGGRAIGVQADVGDRAQVAALFEAARAAFGPVTTLVNNAGYVPYEPAIGYPPDVWDRTIATNLTGVFNCTQAALTHMVERGGGFIVNIASVHSRSTLPGTWPMPRRRPAWSA
ncbi:MAG: SDR family NAD(P)-dependent oxidoreductase [Chloroflexi bacterium]|nr:SDR family NAD(P)-dependent oxidoreductase [Chloroflexota bacterium]